MRHLRVLLASTLAFHAGASKAEWEEAIELLQPPGDDGSGEVTDQLVPLALIATLRHGVGPEPEYRRLLDSFDRLAETLQSSGERGIVTRADVEAHARGGGALAQEAQDAVNGGRTAAYLAPVLAVPGERETRIPNKGVRKVTAQAMVSSAFTAPHVTEFVTVDVTRTMKLVEELVYGHAAIIAVGSVRSNSRLGRAKQLQPQSRRRS